MKLELVRKKSSFIVREDGFENVSLRMFKHKDETEEQFRSRGESTFLKYVESTKKEKEEKDGEVIHSIEI